MLGLLVVRLSIQDSISGGTNQCTPSSSEGVSIQRLLVLLGLVRGALVRGTSAGCGLRWCSRRSKRMKQERLVSKTRRLDSSQPRKDPLFPGIRVRETD